MELVQLEKALEQVWGAGTVPNHPKPKSHQRRRSNDKNIKAKEVIQ